MPPPECNYVQRGSGRPLLLGWGRRDLVCLPSQAGRALELFPDARLHWFDRCGHFPQWDVPDPAARLILQATARASGETTPRAAGETTARLSRA